MNKILLKLLANLYIKSELKYKIIKKWDKFSIDDKIIIEKLVDRAHEIQLEIFKVVILKSPKFLQLLKAIFIKNFRIWIKNKEYIDEKNEENIEDILLDKLSAISND